MLCFCEKKQILGKILKAKLFSCQCIVMWFLMIDDDVNEDDDDDDDDDMMMM